MSSRVNESMSFCYSTPTIFPFPLDDYVGRPLLSKNSGRFRMKNTFIPHTNQPVNQTNQPSIFIDLCISMIASCCRVVLPWWPCLSVIMRAKRTIQMRRVLFCLYFTLPYFTLLYFIRAKDFNITIHQPLSFPFLALPCLFYSNLSPLLSSRTDRCSLSYNCGFRKDREGEGEGERGVYQCCNVVYLSPFVCLVHSK